MCKSRSQAAFACLLLVVSLVTPRCQSTSHYRWVCADILQSFSLIPFIMGWPHRNQHLVEIFWMDARARKSQVSRSHCCLNLLAAPPCPCPAVWRRAPQNTRLRNQSTTDLILVSCDVTRIQMSLSNRCLSTGWQHFVKGMTEVQKINESLRTDCDYHCWSAFVTCWNPWIRARYLSNESMPSDMGLVIGQVIPCECSYN